MVKTQKISMPDGEGNALYTFADDQSYTFSAYDAKVEGTADTISAWLSIFPPLLAIVMALLFREVLTSSF